MYETPSEKFTGLKNDIVGAKDVRSVAELVGEYEGWTSAQENLIESLEKYIEGIDKLKLGFREISDKTLQDILEKAKAIQETEESFGKDLEEAVDSVRSLSSQVSALLNDLSQSGDFTKKWNRYLGQTGNLVNSIEVSLSNGDALSNSQLHTQKRKAEVLKLQHDLLLKQLGISSTLNKADLEAKKESLESQRKQLESDIRSKKLSKSDYREDLKQLHDVYNQLAAINEIHLADKTVKLTVHQEILEKAARRKEGTLGFGAARGFGKLAGALGFSNVSESIRDSLTEAGSSIRTQQQGNLKKALANDGWGYEDSTGNYTRKVKGKDGKESVEVLGDAEYKAYIKNATAAVDTSKLLRGVWTDISKAIFSGATAFIIFTSLWKSFNEVDRSAAELKRNIGSWEISAARANSQFITSVDWLKMANGIVKELSGANAVAIFDKDEIAKGAELQRLTGATEKQAANLVIRSKLVGQNADEYRKSLTAGANEGNRLNRSTITLGEIQKGVLEASDATALSYGNGAKSLAEAVVAAKNLGMELAGIEKISDTLLNFESSIEAEMSAQLLTGQQLNLSRARELALNNDLGGVAREIANQGVTAGKFTNMNRIQQEGIARALGMSREELAKSLILREIENGASTKALAAATQMKESQIEAMAATDKWKLAVDKLKQSFAPILKILGSVLSVLADIIASISGSWVGPTALVVAGLILVAKNILNISNLAGRAVGSITKLGTSIKSLGTGIGNWGKNITGSFKSGKSGLGPGSTSNLTNTAAATGKDMGKSANGTRNLGRALKSFPSAKQLLGLAAALVALGAAAVGFGFAIKLVADAGASTGQILSFLGGFAVVILAAAAAVKVAGTLLADPIVAGGIAALSLLLISLGAAAVGFGFAVKQIAGAAAEFGNVFSSLSPDKLVGIASLGSVLALAGVGLFAFGAALVVFPIKKLARFTESIKNLDNSLVSLGRISGKAIQIPNIQFDNDNIGNIKALAKAFRQLGNVRFTRIALLAASVNALAASVSKLGTSLTSLDTSSLLKLSNIGAPKLKTLGTTVLAKITSGRDRSETSEQPIEASVRKVETAYTANIRQQSSNRSVTGGDVGETVLETKVLEKILTNIDKRLAEGVDLRMNADRLGRILAINQVGIG